MFICFWIRKGRQYIYQMLKTGIHQFFSDLKDLGDIRVVPFTYFCVFSLFSPHIKYLKILEPEKI